MIWGDDDPYGGPQIGRPAAALIRDARLEVLPGHHPSFLDDPQRCGALIDRLLPPTPAPVGEPTTGDDEAQHDRTRGLASDELAASERSRARRSAVCERRCQQWRKRGETWLSGGCCDRVCELLA
jgi:hypothetical protein